MSEDCHDSGFCPACGGNGETGHDRSCPEVMRFDFSDWFEHVYVKTAPAQSKSAYMAHRINRIPEDILISLQEDGWMIRERYSDYEVVLNYDKIGLL